MADASDGVELIVGVRQDARFGPTVMVGMGGLLAEVLRDVTFELAPLSPDDASRMEIRATLKDGVLELHVRKILPDDVSVKPCPERLEVRLEPSNSVEPNEGESRPFFRE